MGVRGRSPRDACSAGPDAVKTVPERSFLGRFRRGEIEILSVDGLGRVAASGALDTKESVFSLPSDAAVFLNQGAWNDNQRGSNANR